MRDTDLRVLIWCDSAWDPAPGLRRVPGIHVAGQSTTLVGAWRTAQATRPEAVIVATRQARADAQALMHQWPLTDRPLLVLIGGLPTDALAAFELGAVDCFAAGQFESRIHEAVRRLHERRHRDQLARQLKQLARQLAWDEIAKRPLPHIDVPLRDGRHVRIATSDVECLETCGNYVRILTAGGEFLHRATLEQCAQGLRDAGFFRAHRRFLVNDRHIVECTPTGDLRLRSGRRVPCSRSYRSSVLSARGRSHPA